ncbi:MAG: hypothetical protein Ct9H300mP21_05760 [Pseudomonadota bacterium]|nr:MAG: hypothetical protein Ct9H300mP21_05760 [Pseudomonadota bacterium]
MLMMKNLQLNIGNMDSQKDSLKPGTKDDVIVDNALSRNSLGRI